ncbi:MAG: response regulator [Elusimicrobiota bacterium]
MDETTFGAPGEKLVLMVDDDESLLDLMEHVVKKEGFRTDRAVDGPEALRKADALNPDLIVLDMMLPGLGGYEVMRQLQAGGHGDIPIVVITGRQMDPAGIKLIRDESNVKEFLLKPVRPAVLTAALHRLLNTQPQRAPGDGLKS